MRIVNKLMDLPEVGVLLNMLSIVSNETYVHSLRVADITEYLLLKEDNFSTEEKTEIVKGALLHDIGKIFVPLNLIGFNGKLDDYEFEIVKSHPAIGYTLLSNSFSKIVCSIALSHHERLNGCGYPYKIKDIPDYVQIVAVADVYEALTNHRAYKPKYSHDKALELLKKDVEDGKLAQTYVDRLCEADTKRHAFCIEEWEAAFNS